MFYEPQFVTMLAEAFSATLDAWQDITDWVDWTQFKQDFVLTGLVGQGQLVVDIAIADNGFLLDGWTPIRISNVEFDALSPLDAPAAHSHLTGGTVSAGLWAFVKTYILEENGAETGASPDIEYLKGTNGSVSFDAFTLPPGISAVRYYGVNTNLSTIFRLIVQNTGEAYTMTADPSGSAEMLPASTPHDRIFYGFMGEVDTAPSTPMQKYSIPLRDPNLIMDYPNDALEVDITFPINTTDRSAIKQLMHIFFVDDYTNDNMDDQGVNQFYYLQNNVTVPAGTGFKDAVNLIAANSGSRVAAAPTALFYFGPVPGTGTFTLGVWKFGLTYTTAAGETLLGFTTSVTITDTTSRIILFAAPEPTPYDYSQVNIYMSPTAGSTDMVFLRSYANPPGTSGIINGPPTITPFRHPPTTDMPLEVPMFWFNWNKATNANDNPWKFSAHYYQYSKSPIVPIVNTDSAPEDIAHAHYYGFNRKRVGPASGNANRVLVLGKRPAVGRAPKGRAEDTPGQDYIGRRAITVIKDETITSDEAAAARASASLNYIAPETDTISNVLTFYNYMSWMPCRVKLQNLAELGLENVNGVAYPVSHVSLAMPSGQYLEYVIELGTPSTEFGQLPVALRGGAVRALNVTNPHTPRWHNPVLPMGMTPNGLGFTVLHFGSYYGTYTYIHADNSESSPAPIASCVLAEGQGISINPIEDGTFDAMPLEDIGINYYLSDAAGSHTLKFVASTDGQQAFVITVYGTGAAAPAIDITDDAVQHYNDTIGLMEITYTPRDNYEDNIRGYVAKRRYNGGVPVYLPEQTNNIFQINVPPRTIAGLPTYVEIAIQAVNVNNLASGFGPWLGFYVVRPVGPAPPQNIRFDTSAYPDGYWYDFRGPEVYLDFDAPDATGIRTIEVQWYNIDVPEDTFTIAISGSATKVTVPGYGTGGTGVDDSDFITNTAPPAILRDNVYAVRMASVDGFGIWGPWSDDPGWDDVFAFVVPTENPKPAPAAGKAGLNGAGVGYIDVSWPDNDPEWPELRQIIAWREQTVGVTDDPPVDVKDWQHIYLPPTTLKYSITNLHPGAREIIARGGITADGLVTIWSLFTLVVKVPLPVSTGAGGTTITGVSGGWLPGDGTVVTINPDDSLPIVLTVDPSLPDPAQVITVHKVQEGEGRALLVKVSGDPAATQTLEAVATYYDSNTGYEDSDTPIGTETLPGGPLALDGTLQTLGEGYQFTMPLTARQAVVTLVATAIIASSVAMAIVSPFKGAATTPEIGQYAVAAMNTIEGGIAHRGIVKDAGFEHVRPDDPTMADAWSRNAVTTTNTVERVTDNSLDGIASMRFIVTNTAALPRGIVSNRFEVHPNEILDVGMWVYSSNTDAVMQLTIRFYEHDDTPISTSTQTATATASSIDDWFFVGKRVIANDGDAHWARFFVQPLTTVTGTYDVDSVKCIDGPETSTGATGITADILVEGKTYHFEDGFLIGTSGTTYTDSGWETPTGTVDGSNDTFTLAHAIVSGSLMVWLNGLTQDPGDDYTYHSSDHTIIFDTAPPSGSKVRVKYRY